MVVRELARDWANIACQAAWATGVVVDVALVFVAAATGSVFAAGAAAGEVAGVASVLPALSLLLSFLGAEPLLPSFFLASR